MSYLNLHPRGVYLDMPADDYHWDQSLSYSGIKAFMASPLTYWDKFLSPERMEQSSSAQLLGQVIHTALLEPERFHERYAVEPDPADQPEALKGVEALRAKCDELGLKKSGTLEEMAAAIRQVDPECLLWPLIMRDFQADVAAGGKTVIKGDAHRQALAAQRAVNLRENVRNAMAGGLPEVSVFWSDPNSGLPMKARFDLLKPKAILDLKSFSNTGGDPVERVVAAAVASRGYHIQAVFYLWAAMAAKTLIREGNVNCSLDERLAQFAQVEDAPRLYFLFLETSPTPNVLLRGFPVSTADQVCLIYDRAEQEIKKVMEEWSSLLRYYGTDKPWILDYGVRDFHDEDFPLWIYGR